jgi:hypothetical protein
MFTRSGVSQSVIDAVSSVIKEEEKKKMLLEPEKKKAEVAEEDEKKSSNPFDVLKGTYKSQLAKKPGELTGHEHKKTTTGNVFMKKYKKDKVEEEVAVNEMDSQGYKGSRHNDDEDAGKKQIHLGPEHMMKSKDAVKKAGKTLNRVFGQSRKKDKVEESVSESQLDEMINEVLSKDAAAGDWIHDFVHSDNPKFKGKSKAERKKQALAAYYAKQRNESVERLDELGGISTLSDEALALNQQTTDTLRGREKGGMVNKHISSKVKLKAEEAHPDEKEDKALVKKMVKPSALKKEEHSPMSLAKDLAKKSFGKIRRESLGKLGTSEEKKHD